MHGSIEHEGGASEPTGVRGVVREIAAFVLILCVAAALNLLGTTPPAPDAEMVTKIAEK